MLFFFAIASTKFQLKLKYSHLNKDTVYLNKAYSCQLQCVRLEVKQISRLSFPKKEENTYTQWILNSGRRVAQEVVRGTKALISWDVNEMLWV